MNPDAVPKQWVEAGARGLRGVSRGAHGSVTSRAVLAAVIPQVKAAALREAANDIQALHPGEIKASVEWLRARADYLEANR